MVFPAKKALITGVDGFTGRYLKTALEKEDIVVYGTTHNQSNEKNTYTVDITDQIAVENLIENIKPNYIIHLAAISFVGHGNANEFYKVNVIGTEYLLLAVQKAGYQPEKIIIASSANVYGNTDTETIGETSQPEPVNHYACSKMAMEKIVSNYFEQLNILIARPFNYTGVGQSKHFLLPKIIDHFQRKANSIELGNLDVSRDYSSVHFIVEAYIKLLQSSHKSEIVNLCSGKSTSLTEIVDIIQDIAGYKISVEVNSELVRKSEIKKITGNNTKLFDLIGPIAIARVTDILVSMYEQK
jgi:nucleoside-diphosphate-sugar epimerase